LWNTAGHIRGYKWWKNRLRYSLEQFDFVRVDHFRGFENYWEIPPDAETATEGKWREGAGLEFFEEMFKELDELWIIAQDLGLITPEVNLLREYCGFPGMKVLQFAFSDENNVYLPHNYKNSNIVAYCGSHDNNSSLGWFRELIELERERLLVYLSINVPEDSVCYKLMRLVWSSIAVFSLAPLQDLLVLGEECRMNLPGTSGGKKLGLAL
jgi:4-alpha-glucanotransferase